MELVDDVGLVASLLVFFRLLRGLLGRPSAPLYSTQLSKKNLAKFGELPDSLKILGEPSQAIGFIHSLNGLELPDVVMEKLRDVYQSPFQTMRLVMTGFSCVGVLASCLRRNLV